MPAPAPGHSRSSLSSGTAPALRGGASGGTAPALRGGASLLCAAVVAALVLFAMPHRLVDADSLSRLATGRFIVHAHALPDSDPFTFSRPGHHLASPEWLGDVLWYGAYSAGGEGAVLALAMTLVALGWVLALYCGVAFGASPLTTCLLLLLMLPASAERLTARNDIHTLWLVPLCALLAYYAQRERRLWFAVLGLGFVWANLHASFLIGWVLVLASLAQARVQRLPVPRRAWIVALVYPGLPLLGPAGADAYRQLADHALGADVYRGLILEWQPSLLSGGVLAVLPLHVLALLGALAFAKRGIRSSVLPATMFALGIGLGYASRRFLPLTAVLAVPGMAAAVSALLHVSAEQRALRIARSLAAALALGYIALGLRSAARRPDVAALQRNDGAQRPARFIAAHAPAGAHVLNAFNDGQWLVFLTAPRVLHYLDPRNNLGAAFLARFVHELLPDAQKFEREARALDITLVLVRMQDPRMRPLAAHLGSTPAWRLTYWDGDHALYARADARNQRLIDGFGYRALHAELAFDAAGAPGISDAMVQHDLRELRTQSPPLADAFQAYLILRRTPGATQADFERAAGLLRSALPELPPAPKLMRYWAESLERSGQHDASSAVLKAIQVLPFDTR